MGRQDALLEKVLMMCSEDSNLDSDKEQTNRRIC